MRRWQRFHEKQNPDENGKPGRWRRSEPTLLHSLQWQAEWAHSVQSLRHFAILQNALRQRNTWRIVPPIHLGLELWFHLEFQAEQQSPSQMNKDGRGKPTLSTLMPTAMPASTAISTNFLPSLVV